MTSTRHATASRLLASNLTRSTQGKAAIAAFDQACALHRKGDVAQARELYLKAGLAHDKQLASRAHFNLGTLAAEEARRLSGEQPETVAPEKRQEVLDQLKIAVASFRHCLELQPENSHARRDIELLRQWIKYYTDRWRAFDREKRRQETNLMAFLEFLIETQRALRESVKALTATSPADAFAEPKRLQDELQEEIPTLTEKIKTELTPQQSAGGSPPQGNSQELEQGIKLLQGWATAAGTKMSSAAQHLDSRRAEPAAADQQSAIDELEKIWDAVIPFQGLLARDLKDQTTIAQTLAPAPPIDSNSGTNEPTGKDDSDRDKATSSSKGNSAGTGPPALTSEREDLEPLNEMQQRTLRRTRLLKLKAEAELERLEKTQQGDAEKKAAVPSPAPNGPPDAGAGKAKPVDPKEIKKGYQKAIELTPRAVEQMERTIKSLKQKDAKAAYPPAEGARKILEEIQNAQPKQEEQDQKQQNEDKKNDDQQKQDQKDQKKKEDEKKDQQKDDQEKKDQQKKDQEKKKQDEPNKSGEQKEDQKKEQPPVSRDRIEEALRKVRERQQEKRDRDRRMNVRVLRRAPVEKDW